MIKEQTENKKDGKKIKSIFQGNFKGVLYLNDNGYSIYIEGVYTNKQNERKIKYLKLFPEEIQDFQQIIKGLFEAL